MAYSYPPPAASNLIRSSSSRATGVEGGDGEGGVVAGRPAQPLPPRVAEALEPDVDIDVLQKGLVPRTLSGYWQ